MESYEFEEDNVLLVMNYAMCRSLIYPYIRNWKFSQKILNDCFKILLLGKKCILRSLLQVRKIFEFSGNHYIINKLFIDDYCTYIQGVDRDALTLFGNEVRYFIRYVTKDKFGLRIVPIEQTALTGEETNDRVYSFSFSDYDESTGTES